MLSKEERDNLIVENQKLVPYLVRKYFNKYQNAEFFEDLISEGYIGLIKATKIYDETKGKFQTVAGYCVLNQVRMWFRQYAKHEKLQPISLETTINCKQDDLRLEDTIASPQDIENDYVEIETKDKQSEAVELILAESEDNVKEVFNERINGKNQQEIANLVGISQPSVARILERKTPKIQNKLKELEMYKSYDDPNKPIRSNYDNYNDYHRDYQRWYAYYKKHGTSYKGEPPIIQNNPAEIKEVQPVIKGVQPAEYVDNKENFVNIPNVINIPNPVAMPNNDVKTILTKLDEREQELLKELKKIKITKETILSLTGA